MSAPRSARCLVRQSRLASPLSAANPRCCLHSSAKKGASKKTSRAPAKSVSSPSSAPLPDRAIINPVRPVNAIWGKRKGEDVPVSEEAATEYFPPYTEEEMQFLRRKYTPRQMEAIMAGESAVDAMDLLKQGAVRSDYLKLNYVDDLRNVHPTLDKKKIAPATNYDPDMRFKTDEEIDDDVIAFWEKMAKAKGASADEPDLELDWEKFVEGYRYTVGRPESELDSPDYLAPELKKLTDPSVKKTVMGDDAAGDEDKERWDRLAMTTGLSLGYLRGLHRKTLASDYVANQTRMGKVRTYRSIVVVGNGNGLLGIGLGKSAEQQNASWQAFTAAVRKMSPIPRYEGRTIYGDTKAKVGASEVRLYNRPPGFGVRCQERIYEMCKCAGILDLAAKVPRSTNKMNTVKATYEALMSQRLPDSVARGRGKKMVDVRKVYYAGMT